MKKILRGDEVVVTVGKDKGKRGRVLRVIGDRVVVQGVNQSRKHAKPNPAKGVSGGFVTKDMPLAISNVAIFNPQTQKADRVGISVGVDTSGSATRYRFFKSTGARIETRKEKG